MGVTATDITNIEAAYQQYNNAVVSTVIQYGGQLVDLIERVREQAHETWFEGMKQKEGYMYTDVHGNTFMFRNWKTQFWPNVLRSKIGDYSWYHKLKQVIDTYRQPNGERWQQVWYEDVAAGRVDGRENLYLHLNNCRKWSEKGYPEDGRPDPLRPRARRRSIVESANRLITVDELNTVWEELD